MPLDGGLEILESSDAAFDELLAHAAQCIGVNLTGSPNQTSIASGKFRQTWDPAFREQWVLRWLLRRFQSELRNPEMQRIIPPASPLANALSWGLLDHVLSVIPVETTAEILVERKVFQTLQQTINILLRSSEPSTRSTVSKGFSATVPADDSPRPAKKRRLSTEKTKSVSSSREDEQNLLYSRVLGVCVTIGGIFRRSHESKRDEASPSSVQWTSSTKERASVLGAVLQFAKLVIPSKLDSQTGSEALQAVVQTLAFWQCRGAATSEATRKEETSVFALFCLGPALALLQVATTVQDGRNLCKALEKLVAVNTVLPLRTKFFTHHAKSWKSQTRNLSWKEIYKLFQSFIRALDMPSAPAVEGLDMINTDWAQHASLLYAVAVKILPKGDIKLTLQEQPWLDALFIFLTYLSCPQLTKLEFIREGEVEIVDPLYSSDLKDDITAFEGLLRVADEQKHCPSLQALGYVSAAVISWEQIERPWPLMAYLINLDADILITNSGIPSSALALKSFLSKVEFAEVTRDDYDLLRDQIIVPLLQAHARARALKDFVELWLTNFQEALRKSSVGVPKTSTIPAVLVWQDEILFEEFAVLWKSHGTPSLSTAILNNLVESLEGLPSRAGSTLDTFAHMALASALIPELTKADQRVKSTQLSEIQHSVLSALHAHSDFQGQRWRLWALLRHLGEVLQYTDTLVDVNAIKGPDDVSLETLAGTIEAESSAHQSITKYRECLERFAFTTQCVGQTDDAMKASFRSEVTGLQQLLQFLMQAAVSDNKFMWSGRLEDLDSKWKLVTACLGVLLARPLCLKTVPGFVHDVREVLSRSDSSDNSVQTLRRGFADLKDLIDTNHEGKSEQTSIENLDSNLDHSKYVDLALQAFNNNQSSKTTFKVLGDKLWKSVTSHLETPTVESVARTLAVLEQLSSKQLASFARAEEWKTWLRVLRKLPARFPAPHTRRHLHVATSIRTILYHLLARSNQRQLAEIHEDLKKLLQKSEESGSLKHLLSTDLALHAIVLRLEAGSELSNNTTHLIREYMVGIIRKLTLSVKTQASEDSHIETQVVQVISILDQLLSMESKIYSACSQKDKATLHEAAAAFQTWSKNINEKDVDVELQLALCDLSEQLLRAVNNDLKQDDLNWTLKWVSKSQKLETNSDIHLAAAEAFFLVRDLSQQARADLLDRLLLSNPSESVRPTLLIASIINSLSWSDAQHSFELCTNLAVIASLETLLSATTLTQIFVRLDVAKLVLDRIPELVNQSIIDTLLGNISQLLTSTHSSSSSSSNPPPAQAIYDRLCTLLTTLLSRFRRRLSDRHHLLLPILQNLLKCLFYPGAAALTSRRTPLSTYSTTFYSSLPTWLTQSSTSPPLPPTSATTLSRILSQICNPTPSAAKAALKHPKTSASSNLNDAVKTIRLLTGSHLQYLIPTYTSSILDGEIHPSVKEKLLPGLYTVIDAMERDVMRCMNSQLDSSGREIWKGLYSAWSAGRWKGD